MEWNSNHRKILKKVLINGVEYGADKIIEIVIDESLTDDGTLQFGTSVSTRCDVKLKTLDIIGENAKVEPFIALEGGHWIKLGEYYLSSRSIDGPIVDLICYDKLFLANRQYVAYSEFYDMEDTTFPIHADLRWIFDDICMILGVEYDNSLRIDPFVEVDKLPYYSATIREVLSYVTTVHGACAKIDRSGKLTLVTFGNKTPVAHIKLSDHFSCRQINPFKKITSIEVNYGERRSWVLGGNWVNGEFLSIHSPYLTVYDEEPNELIASRVPLSYTPLNLSFRGDPNIQVGDYITVEMKDGRTVETIVLRSTLTIGIGLIQTIESPADTGKETEFGEFRVREEVQKQKEVVDKLSPIVDGDDESTFLGYKQNAGIKVGMGVAKSSVTLKHITPSKVEGQPDKVKGIGVDEKGAYVFDEKGSSLIPRIFVSTAEPVGTEGKDGDLWVVVESSGSGEVNG